MSIFVERHGIVVLLLMGHFFEILLSRSIKNNCGYRGKDKVLKVYFF